MLEQLKQMAMQQLAEKMAPNRLNADDTNAAAEQGASAFMETIQQSVGAGNLGAVTELFSGAKDLQSNGVFQGLQGKFQDILQARGMDANEAQAEAQNSLPGLIGNLQNRFSSKEESDSAFDLGAIAKLAGVDSNSILGKVKDLF